MNDSFIVPIHCQSSPPALQSIGQLQQLAAKEAKKGNIGRQTEQVLANIQTALVAAGADLADVVKWNVYVVQGQPLQPAFVAFQRAWDQRPDPPTITAAIAIGLARLELLEEMDAVAVVAE